MWDLWGRWDLVALNVLIFSLSLLFIPFKKKTAIRHKGAFIAFLIALFTEMYGFPLTVYLLAPLVEGNLGLGQWIWEGHLFGAIGIVIGTAILVIGIALIVLGWKKIHKFLKEDKLITDGIYGYMRHPQYTGILMLALGWLIHWPTIVGGLLWPILVLLYYRLAKSEEKELEKMYGELYLDYKRRVSMFLPFNLSLTIKQKNSHIQA